MQVRAAHKCEEVVWVPRAAGVLMWWELPKQSPVIPAAEGKRAAREQ